MNNIYFDYYPELKQLFESMRFNRRDEILDHQKNTDEYYAALINNRARQSMVLRSKLRDEITEFEKYMDLIYEQEIYELDIIYAHAFNDALLALKKLKLL